jgi:hypothetical protein
VGIAAGLPAPPAPSSWTGPMLSPMPLVGGLTPGSLGMPPVASGAAPGLGVAAPLPPEGMSELSEPSLLQPASVDKRRRDRLEVVRQEKV